MTEAEQVKGKHAGKPIISTAFMTAATTIQRDAFPGQDYGYRLWHRVHETPCGAADAWFMSGNGGNVVAAFPKFDAVVVITRTNYNQGRKMHEQTRACSNEHILPALCR